MRNKIIILSVLLYTTLYFIAAANAAAIKYKELGKENTNSVVSSTYETHSPSATPQPKITVKKTDRNFISTMSLATASIQGVVKDASSIKWTAVYPDSNAYGNRLELWNSVTGWRNVTPDFYTKNGDYVSSNLAPGSYMGRLTYLSNGSWVILDTWVSLPIYSKSQTYQYNKISVVEDKTFIQNGIHYQTKFLSDENGNLTNKLNLNNNFTVMKSSFESNEKQWEYNYNNNSIWFKDSSIKKDGESSLRFYSESPVVATAEYGFINVTPKTIYTLSGWILKNIKSGSFYIDWMEYDDKGGLVFDGGTIENTQKNVWQYGNVEFTTQPQTTKLKIRIVCDANTAGTGYVDAIQLFKGKNPQLYSTSFESSDIPWNNLNDSRMTMIDEARRDGIRSMKFSSDVSTTVETNSGLIITSPNTTYTLSGWILNKLKTGNFYIDWMEFDRDGNMVYDGGTIWTSEKDRWQFGAVEFTTRPNTASLSLRVVADGGAAGLGFVDSVQLSKGSNLPLVNTSFELNDLPWNLNAPSSVFDKDIVNVKDGKFSLKFDTNVPITVTADSGEIMVSPNTTYVLKGWIFNNLKTGSFYFDWMEYDPKGSLVFDGGGFSSSEKNKWQYGTVEFTTKPLTTKLEVRIVADGNASGTGFVDAIELRKK